LHDVKQTFGRTDWWSRAKIVCAIPQDTPVFALRVALRHHGTCRPSRRSDRSAVEIACMPKEAELEEKFWKALKSDMTVMLGLAGVEGGHSHPMTAQLDPDSPRGPIWFFSAKDTDFVQALGTRKRAVAHFASKGHDLFAAVDGELVPDNDRARIDRLWNRFVAAWYPGGKDDPKLQLLRLDPDRAQIWLNENSLFAGAKLLLGRDPKKDYKDKVADVKLG
jgi:general stress protein 26